MKGVLRIDNSAKDEAPALVIQISDSTILLIKSFSYLNIKLSIFKSE